MYIESLPYPWGEKPGLSSGIDDPSLWALAFGTAENAEVRHAIKRAAKRTFRDIGVLGVDDDQAFGAATVRLIGTVAGRAELKRQYLDENLLGAWLVDAVRSRHGGILPDLRMVAPIDGDGWHCLQEEPMRQWLAENPLTEESREAVAVFLSAFAMRGQEAARTLASGILEADLEFATLLTGGGSMSRPLDEEEGGYLVSTLATPAEAEREISSPAESGDVSPEEVGRGWRATLSIREWRREIEQLEERLGEEKLRHEDLRQLSDAVRDEGKVVANLPWLRQPMPLAEITQLRENATGAEEQARLRGLQSELGRIVRAHTQAEALTQRLGREPTQVMEGGVVALGDLAIELESVSAELAKEAAAIADIIEIARGLLDRLTAGDTSTVVEMAEGATPEEWSALARMIFDPSLNNSEMSDLRESLAKDELAGLLLARMARTSPIDAGNLVRWLFPASGNGTGPARAETIFAFLSFSEMSETALGAPNVSEVVALMIFAAAIRRNRPDLLEHLAAFFDPGVIDGISREFYRSLLDLYHRGGLLSPAANLREARAAEGEARACQVAAEEARQSLLVWLNSPPGMKKTFHRLRVFAQVQFLLPLRAAIEKDDAASARHQWREFGSLDEMVNACVANLKTTDHPEARHYEQTRSYVEGFEADLEKWVSLASAPTADMDSVLARLLDPLRAEAPRNLAAAALWRAVEGAERLSFPASDFADRLESDERIRMPREDLATWISPKLLSTWPRALEGNARLTHLLADTLRMMLAPGAVTLEQAVKTYLAAGEMEAARRAAIGHPDLQAEVGEALDQRRQAISDRNAGLMAEAEQAAEVDELVAEFLADARTALAEDDFAEATAAFELVEEAVIGFRLRHDPRRQALTEWLEEAGAAVAPNATVETLESQAETARMQALGRRAHLTALTAAVAHPRAAEPVQMLWKTAARRLDRPGCWLDTDDSALLEEAISIVGKNLRGKWQSRLSDTDPSATIVRRIAEWVPERLEAGLKTADRNPLDSVHQLADLLDEGCGDAALLRFLGATPDPALRLDPGPTIASPTPTPIAEACEARTNQAPSQSASLLTDLLREESPAPTADFAKLRLAARAQNWAEARQIAAVLAQADPAPETTVRSDLLAVFGAALLESSPGAPEWLAEATALVLNSRRADHYLGETLVKESAPRAVLRILPSQEDGPLSEKIADSLQRAAELPASDPIFLRLGEFLQVTSAAAPRLVEELWESLTGLPRVEQPRSALLRLLYRLRLIAAMKHLVEKTKEDKVRPIIRACLDAFATAETQPEARPAALQLSAVLREQAVGVANTLPWIHFFHTIRGARAEAEPIAVEADLDSEFPVEDDDGSLWLDLRIQPSLFDPPARLSIRLGNSSAITLFEEPLFTRRTVRVPLPFALEFAADGECTVPYIISGETVSDVSIDQTGTWTITRAVQMQPIDEWRIDMLWPGAKRDPVMRDHGFFGREREIHEIESRLKDSPRARSLMLFGERRIGKTSIIRNVIAVLPPSNDRICGVFSDVSGLQAEPGELVVKFFERIVTFLDNESDNGPIVEALRGAKNRPVRAREIARGLDPAASLFTALDGLARRLEELSNGRIRRLALFVDEFDRFVVPMIGDRREEVNRLMWELRQVIQRSNRVAIVLAGSGLQRLFKENYQDALFGSIDEVSLFRFDWERDRDAILDTFLPEDARLQLCRPADVERVAHRAAEICDGHPMFLALLGSAAAKLADGRPLTPGFFDRVVEAMMCNRGLLGGETLERQVFYGFIFDQIDVIAPRLAAIAKGLFATLAQNTLPDANFSSLRTSRLFEIAALPEATRSEQVEALDRLAKIDAIHHDKTSGRVRISVPLTAAAVREDAPRLREEARERLRSLGPRK